jgi:iron-siderophore transport system permease protein
MIAGSAGLSLVALILTVGLGEYPVAPGDVLLALLGQCDPSSSFVVTELRLPRALVAFGVGAGLAASGVILQGLTRNALAAPELVGVSAGANTAAVIAIVVLPNLPAAALPVCAFVGALATSVLVYALAWRKGSSPTRLLLVGVAITTLGYAIVLGVISSVDDLIHASQLVTFIAGTVYGRGWPELASLVPWLALLLPLALLYARDLDSLNLGDDAASALGLRLEAARLRLIALAAGLAGAAVAVAGPVGFVGLMAPHAARRLVGASHAVLLATAVMLGGCLVLVADAIARTAFAPVDIPVGVVTAIIGAPYLLWLLTARTR